jgi:predicted membrane protein (TIGR00267 family)
LNPLRELGFLLRISHSRGIMRRYFVVNGFDGALTMLGVILGFVTTDRVPLSVVIGACMGAAIALGVSGVSSAYLSETAERQRALSDLEEAMAKSLQDSAHAQAARWVPLLIALVNGAAPLLISLMIITPLWLARAGIPLPLQALHAALVVALLIIFLLGVFIGRVAGNSLWRSGLQTLLVALVTVGLILLLSA